MNHVHHRLAHFNNEDAFVSDFFDLLEARSPQAREAALMAALPRQVAHAQTRSTAFAGILQGVDAASVRDRAARSDL